MEDEAVEAVWAVGPERPRERLLRVGTSRVLDHELIGLVLGTGVRGLSAAAVGLGVLEAVGGIARMGIALPGELARVPGVGAARAARLAAAVELGRRVMEARSIGRPRIASADDVHARVAPRLTSASQERVIVLGLDPRQHVIAEIEVARGMVDGVEVHPREVFRPLVRIGASSCVVAHNHPSGDPTPSPQDVALTRRLLAAGELLGIALVDHVVVAGPAYVSIFSWAERRGQKLP